MPPLQQLHYQQPAAHHHHLPQQPTTPVLPSSSIRKHPSSLSSQPQPSAAARLSPNSVLIVAQSHSHLPTLTDAAATALAHDAEYRVRQILQDAVKFMKHAKRSRLQPHDVNAALRLRNAEPVYGFGAPALTREQSRQQQLQSQKPQQQRNRSVSPTTPGSAATPLPSVLSPHASLPSPRQSMFLSVPGMLKLFFEACAALNVHAAAEDPFPPVPLEVTVYAHWLVLDSVQPRISQNPTNVVSDPSPATSSATGSALGLSSSSPTDPAPTSVQALAKRTVVMPTVKIVISRELQLYYESLTSLLYGNDISRMQSCLASVADEPGIVKLMPYLSAFIAKSVREHTRNLPLLLSLVRLCAAILDNPAFDPERYLHQMLPSIITCLVGKRLCVETKHNHWGLRDYTASVLRRFCARFATSYTNLQGRITRTLTEAIDTGRRPLTTHYGAIVGLAALGPVVVDEFLRPPLPEYAKKVAAVIQNAKTNPVRRYEAQKVYAALAWAVSINDAQHGVSNGSMMSVSGVSRKKPDAHLFPLDNVTVVPDKVDLVLPKFSRLLPGLEKDLGKRLYPFGEGLSPSDLAEKIAAEGGYKESNS